MAQYDRRALIKELKDFSKQFTGDLKGFQERWGSATNAGRDKVYAVVNQTSQMLKNVAPEDDLAEDFDAWAKFIDPDLVRAEVFHNRYKHITEIDRAEYLRMIKLAINRLENTKDEEQDKPPRETFCETAHNEAKPTVKERFDEIDDVVSVLKEAVFEVFNEDETGEGVYSEYLPKTTAGRRIVAEAARTAAAITSLVKDLGVEQSKQTDYPQDEEPNEYRYISPAWIDEIAIGLTSGAKKHPGETWRQIPSKEHLFRAMRHIVMCLAGDNKEQHIINASMRLMMAYETDGEA